MAEQLNNDPYKAKFRPDEATLNQQVDAALEGVSMDQLYGFDKPDAPPPARLRGAVTGKVVSLGADDVFVDLGEKSQGIAPLSQFDEVRIGDSVELVVERYDDTEGLYILYRKGAVAQSVSWDTLEVGQLVEATVTAMNKGGLEVTVKNMRGFMPAGQVDVVFIKDISTLIGQRMTVEVTRVDREHKNLIVSRKHIIEREKEVAREKLMLELAEGQVRRGTVRSVADYGAFVDLGGCDGLLHVSEMSHRRIRNPREVLAEGDMVDVKIVKIDKESGKISLSLKAAMADPWTDAASRYAAGTSVTALVSHVETFGAFLSVEDGIEGLLPASEISYQRIRHPSDVVKQGQTIQVMVLNIDPTNRKLTFSLKQAGPDPWAEAESSFPTHSVVPGKVTRTAEFGAFVELAPGIEGLVHISELANQRVRQVTDVVKAGDEVKVRVLEFDKEKHRISLSIKRAAEPAATAAPAAVAVDPSAPPAPPKKKRDRPLRGGLDR